MVRALIDPDTYCPFCLTEFARRRCKPLARKGSWLLVKNEFPHKNVKQMLLIVPKRHITNLDELTEQDMVSIGKLLIVCHNQFGITGGGIMLRFGDPRLNVGTVEHFHANIIVPNCGKEYRAPFAKNLSEHRKDYARLLSFIAELNKRGGKKWLFSEAGILKTQPAA
ncbi:MAG: hypothetical protein WAW90_01865 [Minisyncoccia bacterium]